MYDIYSKLKNHNSVVIFGAGNRGLFIKKEIESFCKENSKNLYLADSRLRGEERRGEERRGDIISFGSGLKIS
jgi:hypothetical protein